MRKATKRKNSQDINTPSDKRTIIHADGEVTDTHTSSTTLNPTLALSYIQVIDVLGWIPEEQAKKLETWVQIED